MALLGNYSVLNKSPGRDLGGSAVVGSCVATRGAWNKSGANRNRYVGNVTGDGTSGFGPKYGVPNGATPPYSWQIAIVGGGMASYTLIVGTGSATDDREFTADTGDVVTLGSGIMASYTIVSLTSTGTLPGGLNTGQDYYWYDIGGEETGKLCLTAADVTNSVFVDITSAGTGTHTLASRPNLAGGKNAEAALTGSGDLSATLALIVSGLADLSGTGSIAATLNAELNALADLSGTGSVAATLEAVGNILSALTGVGSVSTEIRADGELAADLTPFTELSPQSLAAAVWNSVVEEYTTEGTMGAAERFLYILAHNKITTDPSGGTITIYSEDGSTELFIADLWENTAQTVPYGGSGAEVRDTYVAG